MNAIARPDPTPGMAELPDTIPALFQVTAGGRPDAPALHFKAGKQWVSVSWREYGQAVNRLGNAILNEGLSPQDRVAIWSTNRPEWQIADLGILHAGCVTVAVYPTLAPDQVTYILRHSEAKVLIVADRSLLDQITGLRNDLPALERVILIEGEMPDSDGWVITWTEALRRGDAFARGRPGMLTSRWHAVRPDDMASLIYTSGTTGTPKAAVLTHRNLTWTAEDTLECFPGSAQDRVVSYLPLAHVLERVVSHLRQLCTGCEVYFCPNTNQVMEMVREVHPTYFTSVPRLWEKIYAGIQSRLDAVHGPRALIRDWALRVAARKTVAYEARRHPSALLRWQWALADRLVFKGIREALGFDQILICVSGSAPISPEIIRFFYGIGIEILEGYGLTETTAPATFNRPGEAKFGTVGVPLPGVEVRIAQDGEILVRGKNVFAGYYKDAKETDDALTDGWLKTGDIGELDADGYLKITDRKKDLFKTSGGKYVAPGAMENRLTSRPGIGQAVVLGDGRPFVVALISLDPDAPQAKAGRQDPSVRRLVEDAIAQVNHGLSHPEQIKKWSILDAQFVVGDELTPSFKVKRKRIADKYRAEIDALYAEKKTPS